MKNLSFIFLVLFSITLVHTQGAPTLKAKDQQIGLHSLGIKVEIIGNVATTTYDMLYYNPTNQILEGELSFPLGKSHNVSRFALDINGKLREAVVVDKELGRVAFEEVVRQGIDPALLEKGTGNNYKARIYPIPANGHKRVILAYEQELVFNDGAQFYNLPLGFKNSLEDFKLNIQVFDQSQKPIITEGKIHGLEFSNWKKNYQTSISKNNFIPNKSILIKIPIPTNAQKTIVFEDYFYGYKTLPTKTRLRKNPKSINLYWDVSLSMIERDFEKEKAFINSYLKDLNDITIHLTTFSNTIKSQKTFVIKNGNATDLINTLKHTVYDGGTNYEALYAVTNSADAILLFTDGISTLSEFNLNTSKPIFIINSVVKSNHSSLNSESESSNGSYIDLNSTTHPEALKLIKNEAFKFLGYRSYSKNIEIYPKPGTSVSSDFSISGKNFIKEKLELYFGYGDEITETLIIDLNKINNANENVKRIWAQKKLDHLEIKPKENKDLIKSLGLNYKIVTDYTSLIVLDNVIDYIRYKITPPEELLEEYNKILAQIEERKKESKADSALLNALTVNEAANPEPSRIISAEHANLFGSIRNDVVNQEALEDLDVDGIVAYETLNEESNSRRSSQVQGFVSAYGNIIDSTIQEKYKGSLKIKDRTINTDYIKELRKAKDKDEAYLKYLVQRNNYKKTPAYFVDVSNFFLRELKDRYYASIILSNIPESDYDNYELLKIYAYQMQYQNHNEMAVFIFNRILELRPEDSQSYRDLALAYQNIGKCQKALDLFNSILTGEIYKNNNRRVFEGIKLIAKNEIKHLIKNYKNDLDLSKINPKLIDDVYYDIRVVIDWNHNDTDIDLHVIDPNLEECFYKHQNTKIGGQMSPDMTQGFGPEEFKLKNAIKGDYYIKVKYYGDRYQKIENPTFMKVTLYKNYGSKDEIKTMHLIRLTKKDDEEMIAKLSF